MDSKPEPAAFASTPSQRQIAMVSGHLDLTPSLFSIHYIPALDRAIAKEESFVMGDAVGADTFALNYLLANGGTDIASRITVYASRNCNISKLRELGVNVILDPVSPKAQENEDRRGDVAEAKHMARDARMTAASDYDILWIRSGEDAKAKYGDTHRFKVSATEMNRLRRLETKEKALKETGSGDPR